MLMYSIIGSIWGAIIGIASQMLYLSELRRDVSHEATGSLIIMATLLFIGASSITIEGLKALLWSLPALGASCCLFVKLYGRKTK